RNPRATPARVAALTKRARADGFAARLIEAAQSAPGTPAAFEALAWILKNDGGPAMAATQAEAAQQALRDHLADPKAAALCAELATSRSAAAETVLRGALAKAPARETRGRACVALRDYLVATAAWADFCQYSDAAQRKMMNASPEGEALQKRMSEVDAEGLREESRGVAARIEKEFADLKPKVVAAKGPAPVGPPIGMPAPEITGEDLGGKAMKLSDYRGKVVVIEFWAWWCVYCRALVPPDERLVSRMRGRPFAILGVNADRDPAAAEKAAEKEGFRWPSWRSWRDGAAIAARWGVNRWPTTIVLDHRGVVRHVGLTGRALEEAVEALVKEVPGEKGK
ncbi:MAG TPA: TlpA disulfide reductase family protein, partial [Planctomycetia bacterium]|nr:TlpA disulfide reductase family protein [Planctomycetia bacterium]